MAAPVVVASRVCAALAPPPPYGLPPWSPGMAPPIPGPVFSPAFKALLVLMAAGAVYLAYTLHYHIKKIREGGIGEDNAMLTAAEPGSADWMRSIQISKGTMACKGSPVDLGGKLPKPRGTGAAARSAEAKRKGGRDKGKGGRSRRHTADEEEAEEIEETLPPARSKPKKTLRAGGARGLETEMAPIKPRR